MNNEEIKVLIKSPNTELQEVCITNNYHSIREIIGGNIDYMRFKSLLDKNIDVIVNDEFLIDGSEISLAYGKRNNIEGIIKGEVMFVANNDDETDGLNKDQIDFIKNLFDKYFTFDRQGNIVPVIEI